jgi:hypothetical protein
MRSRAQAATLACAALLLAGCVTDSGPLPQPLIGPHPEYNAFLNRVQKACAGKQIGNWAVDDLIDETQNFQGDFFYTQTRRLYYGRTSPQDYATGVSSVLDGWPSDPGVKCVLQEYAQHKSQQQLAAPPSGPPGSSAGPLIGPHPQYDAFLGIVQKACAGQKIGPVARVDNLIEDTATPNGNYFYVITRKLYYGRTSPQDYALGVSAFLDGWPSDPGVKCVLHEYEQHKP